MQKETFDTLELAIAAAQRLKASGMVVSSIHSGFYEGRPDTDFAVYYETQQGYLEFLQFQENHDEPPAMRFEIIENYQSDDGDGYQHSGTVRYSTNKFNDLKDVFDRSECYIDFLEEAAWPD